MPSIRQAGNDVIANIEGEPIRLSAFVPQRARAICPNILLPSSRTEFLENRLNLDVTGSNLLLIHIIERKRLLRYKQMFWPIMAGQSLLDHLRARNDNACLASTPASPGYAPWQ